MSRSSKTAVKNPEEVRRLSQLSNRNSISNGRSSFRRSEYRPVKKSFKEKIAECCFSSGPSNKDRFTRNGNNFHVNRNSSSYSHNQQSARSSNVSQNNLTNFLDQFGHQNDGESGHNNNNQDKNNNNYCSDSSAMDYNSHNFSSDDEFSTEMADREEHAKLISIRDHTIGGF